MFSNIEANYWHFLLKLVEFCPPSLSLCSSSSSVSTLNYFLLPNSHYLERHFLCFYLSANQLLANRWLSSNHMLNVPPHYTCVCICAYVCVFISGNPLEVTKITNLTSWQRVFHDNVFPSTLISHENSLQPLPPQTKTIYTDTNALCAR